MFGEEALEKLGYTQYATEPYEKWHRMIGDYELRIRESSESELSCYGGNLMAKVRKLDGSRFGTGFETFSSDDPVELDKLMEGDIKNA